MQMRAEIKLYLLLILTIGLTACGGDGMDDLREYVEQTKTRFQGEIDPLPAVAPYQQYWYQVAEMRDPFRTSVSLVKSISIQRSNNGISPNVDRNREELERFTLESLTLVGMLNNEDGRWAIIRAPDSTIYRVRKGNYMGQNHGRILEISETEVKLKEIVADGIGGWIERPNKLTLSQ
jgi:type IV pilus assembly protein PilP